MEGGGGRRNLFRRAASFDHDREYPLFKPVDHHQSPREFEFEFGSNNNNSFFQGMISADEIFSNGKMLPCSCIHKPKSASPPPPAATAAPSKINQEELESENSNLVAATSKMISRQNSMPARLQERAPQIASAACSTRWMDIVNRFRKSKKNSSDDSTSITSGSSSASSSSRRFLLLGSNSSSSLIDDDPEPLLAFHSKSCFAHKIKPRPKKSDQHKQQQQQSQNPHLRHQHQQQQHEQRKTKSQQQHQSSNLVGRTSSSANNNNRRSRIYPKITHAGVQSQADMIWSSKDPAPKSKSRRRSKEFGWVLYEQQQQEQLRFTTTITTTPPQLLLNMPVVCMGDSSLKLSRFDPVRRRL